MELARSTYYDEPKSQPIEEALLIGQITEICAEFPRYGYRRVAAQLHEDGIVVNHKKVMRLMKEHGLTVQPRRRYVVITDSDHDGPIFPNLAKKVTPTGPNQLWVADITYIAIATSFVYLAAGNKPGRTSARPPRSPAGGFLCPKTSPLPSFPMAARTSPRLASTHAW